MSISARELSRKPPRDIAYLWQVAAVIALAMALKAFDGGLWSAASPDPNLDLEAGGGFAASFFVYAPFFLLILPCVVIAGIYGLSPYRGARAAILVGAAVVSVFAQWVGTQIYLTDYKPALSGRLDMSILCAGLANIAALVAIVLRYRTGVPGRSRKAAIVTGVFLVIAALASTVATAAPLLSGDGRRGGVIAWTTQDPHCGRQKSDWVDTTGATTYSGTVTYPGPPNADPGPPGHNGEFEVAVALRTDAGTTITEPDTSMALKEEISWRFHTPGNEVILYRYKDDASTFTRLWSPVCADGGTRVTSANYTGTHYPSAPRDTVGQRYQIEGILTRGR